MKKILMILFCLLIIGCIFKKEREYELFKEGVLLKSEVRAISSGGIIGGIEKTIIFYFKDGDIIEISSWRFKSEIIPSKGYAYLYKEKSKIPFYKISKQRLKVNKDE